MTSGRFGCAAALGAALALPAGVFIGSRLPEPPGPERSTDDRRSPAMPNRYAPNPLSDPYVKDQHLRIVEALELSCRREKLHCTEAAQARRSLEAR